MMAHLSLWFIKNAFPALFLNCIFISVLQCFKANHNSKALYKKVKATERGKTDTLNYIRKEKAYRIILVGPLKYDTEAFPDHSAWNVPPSMSQLPNFNCWQSTLLLRITLPPILEAPKNKDLSASPMYSQQQKWHLAKIRHVVQICHMNDFIKRLNFFLLAPDEVGGMIPTPAN